MSVDMLSNLSENGYSSSSLLYWSS